MAGRWRERSSPGISFLFGRAAVYQWWPGVTHQRQPRHGAQPSAGSRGRKSSGPRRHLRRPIGAWFLLQVGRRKKDQESRAWPLGGGAKGRPIEHEKRLRPPYRRDSPPPASRKPIWGPPSRYQAEAIERLFAFVHCTKLELAGPRAAIEPRRKQELTGIFQALPPKAGF